MGQQQRQQNRSSSNITTASTYSNSSNFIPPTPLISSKMPKVAFNQWLLLTCYLLKINNNNRLWEKVPKTQKVMFIATNKIDRKTIEKNMIGLINK